MSLRPGPHDGDSSQYRRGALMGFTVAESFMLIAFALLLLLMVWRFTEAERTRGLEFLTRAQLDSVSEAAADGVLGDLLNLRDVPKKDLTALATGAAVVPQARLKTLEDANRLVAEEEIRLLAEAATKMPPDLRRRLTDMVRLEDYRDLLERLEALDALEQMPAVKEALKDLSSEDRDQLESLSKRAPLSEWTQALSEGKSPAEVAKAIALAEQMAADRDTVGGIERAVAERIRARTGRLVAEMGGEITESGDVILPDALLFAAGKATLTPEMGTFLDRFCRPWFEILHEAGDSLSSVQIEGHASSEWQDLAPQSAYLQNLGLSQARARAVFAHCLEAVGGDAIGAWARDKLAAVGYSSARRIVVDGVEDHARSRRVVFNIDADETSFLERFDAAKSGGGAGPSDLGTKLLGDKAELLSDIVTHVRDGDTIVVGTTPLRLSGLHAPELNEQGGPQAADAMRKLVEGERVDCRLTGERTFDRLVAVCEHEGVDLAETLISKGLARDCPRFSHGRYAAFEQKAALKFALPDYCWK